MHYPQNTLYVVGNSKSQQNNPITQLYGQFFIGFIVDRTTGNILDVECNAIIEITKKFLEDILVGESLMDDYDIVRNKVLKRYLGSSQRAILVAYKDAQKKFQDFKAGKPLEL